MTATFRLNADHRTTIKHRLLKHKFSDLVEALYVEKRLFAAWVYEDVFTPAERKRMNDLPDGWLKTDSDIKVQFGESVDTLQFNGAFHYGYSEREKMAGFIAIIKKPADYEYKRMPWKRIDQVCRVYEATSTFAIVHERLQNAQKDLFKSIVDIAGTINASLNQIVSSKQLLEKWPEVAPFIDGLYEPPAKVPAIRPDVLNEMLDLPVTAKDVSV